MPASAINTAGEKRVSDYSFIEAKMDPKNLNYKNVPKRR